MQVFRCFSRTTNLSRNSVRAFSLPAHGTKNGKLVNLVMPKDSDEYKYHWERSGDMYELSLNHRHTCDIELLLNGAFSPLEGFMTQDVYNKVVHESHLPSGAIWPMPITLDISEKQASEIEKKGVNEILLRDGEGNPIAVMEIEDMWKPNKKEEGEAVFGGDPEHPAVSFLNNYTQNIYIGGKIRGFQLPPHYDYHDIRKTPQQVRDLFATKGWNKVVAFQTRNPMHRAHFELTKRALELNTDMNLLVHPVVGMTKPGDIDHHTRVKCYREIMPKFPKGRAELAVFPLAMRMGGPREAIWHALIRKNYGATHFILGRDHAGPGSNSKGVDFYSPYAARDAAVAVEKELGGIKCMAFEMMVFSPEDNVYYPDNEVPKNKKVMKLSGTEVRKRLRTGEEIPEWFSFKEVVNILRQAHPPRHKQGFVVFFTGLSGSGKSTVANALREKLMEMQDRRVAMLDGDYVRKLISSELGFSHEHRNLNIKRIGFISSLISNSGGIVISAPIAPYKESRDFARQVCNEVGGYVEVWISTPVSTCEQRDRKGLYAQARANKIKLTGVNDPYENPIAPELTIDTTNVSIADACDTIINYLTKEGYLQAQPQAQAQKQEKTLDQ